MRSFAEILAIAAERKGGVAAALADMPPVRSADALAAITDDRWLAQMARGIFQAGISWQVVETKWPGIEDAFSGFDPGRVQMIADEALDRLVADPRVIRSGPKIVAIRDNAAFVAQVAAASGSFGRRIGDWPVSDFVGLLAWLGREGSRLGGSTGAYVLRFMGKEGFILSRDVVGRLQAEGVISGAPGSARSMQAIQAAFDAWKAESGQSFTAISRVLARSIG